MIHHVFANKSNVGDWLSAKGIQSQLAPAEIREHFCDAPFIPDTLAQLAEVSRNDLVIIGGGGLFMDYFTPFWEGFRPLAGRLNFCVWGVGVCDIKQAASTCAPRQLLTEIIRQSQSCHVRDELTRAYLNDCPLPPPVPCPSLLVVTPPAQAGWGMLHVDHLTIVGDEVYERMCEVGRDYAARTGRTYAQTNNRIPPGDDRALGTTLDRYAAADLILTSRLHGCILGLAMGRKVLAVSGDRKLESFMQAAGLAEWVCDLADIDSLPRRLECLPHQPTPSVFMDESRHANRQIGATILAAT